MLFLSGLRGAIAFALSIENTLLKSRQMMLTGKSEGFLGKNVIIMQTNYPYLPSSDLVDSSCDSDNLRWIHLEPPDSIGNSFGQQRR